jgi:hypothetical protein
MRRHLYTALAGCALLCAIPATAAASATQVSIVQDDLHLVYRSQDQAVHTLDTLASLGADWVKISMIWGIVAPNAHAKHRPAFDASDPGAYPPGAWNRYDTLVRVAQSLGLKVYFQFDPPSPRWAFDPRFSARVGAKLGHAPLTNDFKQFVEAVGRRYSGSYQSAGSPLPRVGIWGIWNEPNYPAWLRPTERRLASGAVEKLQPPLYRGLVDAAWSGLQAAGHSGDTVLIGETANPGTETPVPFIKDLYCLGSGYAPLAGRAATSVGCPTSPNRARFVAQHPGLFQAAGWAHHPYSFDVAPNRRYPQRQWITLDNIGELEHVLNRTLSSYVAVPSGGVPLYVTEWGYRTNPPNPFLKTTLAQQQKWLDEGDYMLWRQPYVQSIAQFLLLDGPPLTQYPRTSRKRYFNFQTGLEYSGGRPKPSFASYRVPVWLPDPHHGAAVTVWGQLRTASHSSPQTASIEFRRSPGDPWSTIGTVQTTSPEGFFLTHVAIASSGRVRVAFADPRNGRTDYSRIVPVG